MPPATRAALFTLVVPKMPEQNQDQDFDPQNVDFVSSNVDFDVITAEEYFNQEYSNTDIENIEDFVDEKSSTNVVEIEDTESILSEIEETPTVISTRSSSILGFCLAMASGLIFTVNNCVIQTFSLDFAETMLIRSIFQTVIFGFICLGKGFTVWPKIDDNSNWIRFLIVFQGLCGSVVTICAFSSVLFMPLGDALTLLFTEPLSTMIAAAIFLGHRIRLFRMALGFILLIGVVLVIQPPFLFDENDTDFIQTYFMENPFQTLFQVETSRQEIFYRSKLYYIGAIIAFSAAMIKGILNISISQCSKVKSVVLMWWTGFEGFFVALLTFTFDTNAKMLSADILTITYTEWLLYCGIAVLGLIGYFCMTKSLQMIDPTLVAFVRSLEIIFGYVVQITILRQIPTILSLTGAILVFASVTAFSMQYRIMALIPYAYRVIF